MSAASISSQKGNGPGVKPTSFFNGYDWAKWTKCERDSFVRGLLEATLACRRAYDDILKSKYFWTGEQLQNLFFDVIEESPFSFLDATGFGHETVCSDIDAFYKEDQNRGIPIFAAYRLFDALRNGFVEKKDLEAIVHNLRAVDWQFLGITKK
jgi:hypothetical protein